MSLGFSQNYVPRESYDHIMALLIYTLSLCPEYGTKFKKSSCPDIILYFI